MDIDDRLERLTARHEALAQSLEIIAGMVQANAAAIAAHAASIGAHHEMIQNLTASTTDLLRIAEIREKRITGPER